MSETKKKQGIRPAEALAKAFVIKKKEKPQPRDGLDAS